jgi:hypothetical protein
VPDPVTGVVAGAGVLSGVAQDRASRRATRAQQAGQEASIAEQRAAREEFRELSQPFLEAGQAGINPLLNLLGIGDTGGQPALLEEINPLVGFLRDQGFEQIQESAAGRGFTGGTLNELAQFNTQLAAQVGPQLQQQRFNQLFNLVGLGANTATGVGTAGLQSAQNIGAGLANIGAIQGRGALNRGNIIGSTLGDVAGTIGFGSGGGFNFLSGGG